jgi:hypothetical protein
MDLTDADLFAMLLPLGAVALGVAWDISRPDKKFGRLQLAAIILGLTGFFVAFLQLSGKEAKAARDREAAEAERKVAQETQKAAKATESATKLLHDQTAEALKRLETLKTELQASAAKLRPDVANSTRKMEQAVDKSGQDTRQVVDDTHNKVGLEIRRVENVVNTTTSALISGLASINTAVANSQTSVTNSVEKTARLSAKAFDEAMKRQTAESIAAFDASIGGNLARVPFSIGEHETASFLGELADYRIHMKEIRKWSSNAETIVELRCGESVVQRVQFVFGKTLPPENYCGVAATSKDGKVTRRTPCIRLLHEGKKCRLERTPRTPWNLVGQADDTLLCQVIRE